MANFYIWNTKTNEVIEDNSKFWVDCVTAHRAQSPFFMVDARAEVDPEARYGWVYLHNDIHPMWVTTPNGKEGFPKEFQLALLLLGVQ